MVLGGGHRPSGRPAGTLAPVTVGPAARPDPAHRRRRRRAAGCGAIGAFLALWSAATVSVFGVVRDPDRAAVRGDRGAPRRADRGRRAAGPRAGRGAARRVRRRGVGRPAAAAAGHDLGDLGRAVLLGVDPGGGARRLADAAAAARRGGRWPRCSPRSSTSPTGRTCRRSSAATDLVRANGALAATRVGGRVRRLRRSAAFLVKVLTAPIAIALDALSFVVSALLLGTIRRPEPPPPPAATREPIVAEIRAASRSSSGDPVLRGPALGDDGAVGDVGRVRRDAGCCS